MSRFLSKEWFSEAAAAPPDPPVDDQVRVVIEQVVTDSPDGEVRYRVLVGQESARVEFPPSDRLADVTITTDWDTACAIHQGRLSTERALLDGRLRFGGDPTRLDFDASKWGTPDPLAPALRQRTTY